MRRKNILGIGLIVLGAVLWLGADYIADQVAEGKMRIASGQRTVDSVNTLFNQSEYTKPFSGAVTGSSQRKIDHGRMQIAHYESLADKLRIGGILLIVAGVGVLIFYKK